MSTTMLPPGSVTGRTGANGSHHRLLHWVNLCGLGSVAGTCHGTLFLPA